MQRVTNCLIINNQQVLLLKKPRYGWYAMPGGKMESGESIKESVIREVREETGLLVANPQLYSVATMTKKSAQYPKDEWMMFTFKADKVSGELVKECSEGELEWVDVAELASIPTAPSDRIIHKYMIELNQQLFASFALDEHDQLISYRLN
ncbi:8-oxo-dGTP diphosphatase [Amphibacillus sediminis]|uniref:8-oxo-dGTP diphosphatase n=1 Tax=Amphibacillus sediminis TaxID=360185 RepID=UPI000835B846|nr:8-oxo-dGTP diphosphatase [Amphibacillus sediminis]